MWVCFCGGEVEGREKMNPDHQEGNRGDRNGHKGRCDTDCGGLEPFPILPCGEIDLSIPGKTVKFVIGGVLFLAIRSQVVGMIKEWPRRKAALFGVVE